jgi:hypothetical protein
METTWLDDGIRVTDAAKNTVVVRADGWSREGNPPSVAETLAEVETGPDDPDVTLSGSVRRLTYPPVISELIRVEDGSRESFGNSRNSMQLDGGQYLLRADANVRLFVRFDSVEEVSLRPTGDSDGDRRNELVFPEQTPVSIAFESQVDVPSETITVPETPSGVATALSMLSVANETTSPDRTWPTMRNRPPLVEFGAETVVPSSVREERADTGIELRVPPDLRYLFTSASLVHYLGARVTVEEGVEPRLRGDGWTEPLPEFPTYQERAADVLARCFYLDCIARSAGPHGKHLAVEHVFDDLDLDAERLYDASMSERARTYLDVPFETVADEFPEWPLSMYVEPTFEHVETLPHLLKDVPNFFLPVSNPLSKDEWLELSSNDSFSRSMPEPPEEREGLRRVTREISNVDLVQPELGPGLEHGWLADDVPIEVFKTFPEAYENRRKYLSGGDSQLTVAAVLNNAEMREEHDRAIEHYEMRADELNIDITVKENIPQAELARTFEQRHDLVHFIGHREPEGLECSDGYLSTSCLSESNARTFFLNACGSYPEGRDLVKKGSIAGGVTFESVLDSDAARVGTTFARLIVLGFSVKQGLDYARRQLMMPKDYAVVGDGSHVVAQNNSLVPPKRWLFQVDEDTFRLLSESYAIWAHGGNVRSTLDEPGCRYLYGRDRVYTVSRSELDEYLELAESPIVYRERLYWPDELAKVVLER